jgi:hypothetical protein
MQGIATRSISGNFGLYAGFGPLFGFRDLPEGQWGAGAIANLGASFGPMPSLSVGLELSAVGYYNAHDEKRGVGISPSWFASYHF